MNGIAFFNTYVHGYVTVCKISEKEDNLSQRGVPKCSRDFAQKFQFFLSLESEFLEFSISKLFEFRKFHTFGIFWRFVRKFYYILWHSLPFLIKFSGIWRLESPILYFCSHSDFPGWLTFVKLNLICMNYFKLLSQLIPNYEILHLNFLS